jgi:hypothetical protein
LFIDILKEFCHSPLLGIDFWLGKTIFGEATSFFIPLDLPSIQAVFGEGLRENIYPYQ